MTLRGMFGLRISTLLTTLVAIATLVSPADAQRRKNRKKKVTPACGIDYLPLVAGTTWEYAFSAQQAPTKAKGINIPPPERFTVEVLSVEPVGKRGKIKKAATIKLKETYRTVVKETEITCDENGMYVSPQSFLYTGELGGGLQVTLSEVKRGELEYTWPTKKNLRDGGKWREDVVAVAQRAPAKDSGLSPKALPPATVEMEREAKYENKEDVTTTAGEFKDSIHVVVGLRGRAKGDHKKASVNMPDSRAEFWFAKDVGLVRVTNRFAKTFDLAAVRTPDAK